MRECPLCSGAGKLEEKKPHFGDGRYEPRACLLCRGSGQVEVLPAGKSHITIIKPHGIWGMRSVDS